SAASWRDYMIRRRCALGKAAGSRKVSGWELSAEISNQHEVVAGRGVRSGKEDRFSVRRHRQAGPPSRFETIQELALSGRQTEESHFVGEAGLRIGPRYVIDARVDREITARTHLERYPGKRRLRASGDRSRDDGVIRPDGSGEIEPRAVRGECG